MEGRLVDLIVTAAPDGEVWSLNDLLGRSMGTVHEAPPGRFTIHPAGHARETMAGLEPGPHASLDAALAEIERHTRGLCRRLPDEDGS